MMEGGKKEGQVTPSISSSTTDAKKLETGKDWSYSSSTSTANTSTNPFPELRKLLVVPTVRIRTASDSQVLSIQHYNTIVRERRNSLRAAEEALAGGLSNIHMPPM